MSMMLNGAYCVFLTTMTGSIGFLMCEAVIFATKRKADCRLIGRFFKVTALLYSVPVLFLLFCRKYRLSKTGVSRLLFVHTPEIERFAMPFVTVWCIGMLGMAACCFWKYHKHKRLLGVLTPCEPWILEEFSSLKKRMRVWGKLRLVETYAPVSPEIIGIVRPRLILPYREAGYTEEILRVILIHELVHYRRRDVWFRWLAVIGTCVQWYNPLVHLFLRESGRWCEYSCDSEVVAELQDGRLYQAVLARMALQWQYSRASLEVSMLQNQGSMLGRIKMMEQMEAGKNCGNRKGGYIAALLLATWMFSYIAGEGTVKLYDQAIQNTLILETGMALSEDKVRIAEIPTADRSVRSGMKDIFLWDIDAGEKVRTAYVDLEEGEWIRISVAGREAKGCVSIGLLSEEGTVQYADGREGTEVTFEIPESGKYAVLVWSRAKESVRVVGLYKTLYVTY